MTRRTTIRVGDLVAKFNGMIAATPDDMARERSALASALESVLHDTGNYRGFSYLPSECLPAEEQTADTVLRAGFDDTRRRYFA